MPWYGRRCDGCGEHVAARTDDPEVWVLCIACHSEDLPFYPGEPMAGGTVCPKCGTSGCLEDKALDF